MSRVKLRDKARKDRLKPNCQGSRILYLGIRISIFRLLRVNLYSYLKTNFIDNNKGFGDKKKKAASVEHVLGVSLTCSNKAGEVEERGQELRSEI